MSVNLSYLKVIFLVFFGLSKYIAGAVIYICSARVDGGEEYYPFQIPWNDSVPFVVGIEGKVHDAPAGKHGYIKALGDKLYFEDGSRARFWGVGLTFSSGKENIKSPPTKSEADSLVSKLVKYGFNHVRFVGFDVTAPEVSSQWLSKGMIFSKTLDRFDYLVSKLKDAGIYYSISINNSAWHILKDQEGGAMNGYSVPGRKFKNIRLFHEQSIRRQEKWFRDFFSHENKYTGQTLAEDPANIFINAVNEDSIFEAYFSGFKYLTSQNIELLETRFIEYLRKKYSDTNELRVAWAQSGKVGLRKGELLNGYISIVRYGENNRYSSARLHETIEFLINIDIEFSTRIKMVLDKLGYKGLYTGTNNWYGFGALFANYKVGNYIETHGYFDHPKKAKNQFNVESIGNHSYISAPSKTKNSKFSLKKDRAFPLYRAFVSALNDRPLILSEWNHAGWSDYSYEGPIMLMAYGSFQGYPVLDAHTYFTHPDPEPKSVAPYNSLAIGANPVFMALSPSLSLAFIRGYISEPDVMREIYIADRFGDYLDLVLRKGSEAKFEGGLANSYDGFIEKLRVNLIGKKKIAAKVYKQDIVRYEAVTKEIVWDFSDFEKARLVVDTPQFKSVAGKLGKDGVAGDGFQVWLDEHGAITMVSLDGLPIKESKSILVTTVQSFRNTGMIVSEKLGRRYIVNAGKPPTLMRNITGKLKFSTTLKTKPNIMLIYPGGKSKKIDGAAVKTTSKGQEIVLPLGGVLTPWIHIKFI